MSDSALVIGAGLRVPRAELRFRTSRSGGPGGQNVNKLETRVELLFDIAHSPSLTDQQRKLLLSHLKSKVDADGMLRVVSQESRSQWKNKQDAVEKFVQIMQRALKPKKKRVQTAPSHASKEERVRLKKLRSEKKQLRKVTVSDE